MVIVSITMTVTLLTVTHFTQKDEYQNYRLTLECPVALLDTEGQNCFCFWAKEEQEAKKTAERTSQHRYTLTH